MRIFLSARYGRRLELCGYRDELIAMGHTVCVRWLHGPDLEMPDGSRLGTLRQHAIEGGRLRLNETYQAIAHIDIEDVLAAECFVSFTEPPDSDASRGGRHVEFGFVLGYIACCTKFEEILRKPGLPPHRVIVVGHRENLFHWLSQCEFAETWEKAKTLLQRKE